MPKIKDIIDMKGKYSAQDVGEVEIEISKDGLTFITITPNEMGGMNITGNCKICGCFPCKHIDTSKGKWEIKEIKT